jgi:hypothetical protein
MSSLSTGLNDGTAVVWGLGGCQVDIPLESDSNFLGGQGVNLGSVWCRGTYDM